MEKNNLMIKRIEKRLKNIDQENEISGYLEHYEVINQKDELEELEKGGDTPMKKGKENYFCTICKINFLKNKESLCSHLDSKVFSF